MEIMDQVFKSLCFEIKGMVDFRMVEGEHEAVCGVVVTGGAAGAAGALWGCVITLLFHSAPWTLVAWAGTEAGPGLRLRTCQ